MPDVYKRQVLSLVPSDVNTPALYNSLTAFLTIFAICLSRPLTPCLLYTSVVLAGIINGLKVTGKTKEDCQVVVNGAGSAGIAITKLLLTYGFKHVTMCDKSGILSKASEGLNWMQQSMMEVTNLDNKTGSLADALRGADIFV